MSIAVISHEEEPSVVVLAERVAASGRQMSIYRPFSGEALPDLDRVTAVIALGGSPSAYDHEQHPYLRTEIEYLAEAHRLRVPVLGICLGFQLLAEALGGKAIPGTEGLECGLVSVRSAGGYDWPPEGTYYSFHSDTAELPEEAEVRSLSDQYIQAWRLGSSVGIQFHPEVDSVGFDRILAFETDKLERSGVDVADLRSELANPKVAPPPSAKLFDDWLASLPAD